MKEVRKRRNRIKIGDKDYNLRDIDTSNDKILEELKKA